MRDQTPPPTAELRTMTARFAPADIGADMSALPADERAGAGASWSRPRGSWTACSSARSGRATTPCCSSSARRRGAPSGRAARGRGAAALLPDQQGPVVAARPQPAPSSPGVPAEAGSRELLSGRRDQGRGRAMDRRADRRGQGRRHRLLHDHPPRRRRASRRCRTRSSTRASSRAPPRSCVRPRPRRRSRRSRSSSPPAPTRSCRTTTTPATWRGWSSTPPIEPTIGPYEVYEDEWFNAKAAFEAFITVRDDAETKKLQSFSAHLQELENALPIDPRVPQPAARRPRADPRRQRGVRRRRRQSRRPDGRLQPAERRTGRPREGHEARDAEEHAGREVQDGPGADREGRAARRRSRRTCRSTPSSPTS